MHTYFILSGCILHPVQRSWRTVLRAFSGWAGEQSIGAPAARGPTTRCRAAREGTERQLGVNCDGGVLVYDTWTRVARPCNHLVSISVGCVFSLKTSCKPQLYLWSSSCLVVFLVRLLFRHRLGLDDPFNGRTRDRHLVEQHLELELTLRP
jgi:hypothetical protein